MILGCNTVLFGGYDLQTALRGIAWAGYAGVELSAIPSMAEHLRIDLGPAHTAEVRRLAAEHGLILTAVEAASNDRERLTKVLQSAAEAGIPIVNTGPGGKTGDESSLARSIDFLGEMADVAAGLGVKLAAKAHVGAAIHDTATTLRAARAISSPGFGIDFDPSHIFRAGEDPEVAVRALGDRLVHVHIRDCVSRELRVGPPPDQVPGRGSVGLVALLQSLKEMGFAGPVNLEIIGALKHELWQVAAIAAESRGYLHRCVQEVGLA